MKIETRNTLSFALFGLLFLLGSCSDDKKVKPKPEPVAHEKPDLVDKEKVEKERMEKEKERMEKEKERMEKERMEKEKATFEKREALIYSNFPNVRIKRIKIYGVHPGFLLDFLTPNTLDFQSSTKLTDAGINTVKKLAELLKEEPFAESKITVRGHSNLDHTSYSSNFTVSLNRADKVRKLLIEEGVSRHRFTQIQGIASEEPLNGEPNRHGNEEDRRVSLQILLVDHK